MPLTYQSSHTFTANMQGKVKNILGQTTDNNAAAQEKGINILQATSASTQLLVPNRRLTINRLPSGFTAGGQTTPNAQTKNNNDDDDATSTFSKVSKSVRTMKMRNG